MQQHGSRELQGRAVVTVAVMVVVVVGAAVVLVAVQPARVLAVAEAVEEGRQCHRRSALPAPAPPKLMPQVGLMPALFPMVMMMSMGSHCSAPQKSLSLRPWRQSS